MWNCLCFGKKRRLSLTDEPSSSKTSQHIDLMLQEQKSYYSQSRVSVLLLGTSESGKSTVLKQIRLKYGSEMGFSDSEKRAYKLTINQNIITILWQLLTHMEKLDIQYQRESRDRIKEVKSILDELQGSSPDTIPAFLHDFISSIWKDRGVLNLVQNYSKEIEILDSYNYWFPGEIERVLKEDYVPTNEDILNSRAATIGVVSYDYEYQNINIRIVDVGGTRSQRNNWLKLFQDFPSFVFVASLGDYEKPSFENESNSRLLDSIDLFDAVVNHKCMRKVPIILFLNKIDIFQRKLDPYPLKDVFPNYNYDPQKHGTDQIQFGSKFIRNKYLARIEDKKRQCHAFLTCATDRKNLEKVLESITSMFIMKNLMESGIMTENL